MRVSSTEFQPSEHQPQVCGEQLSNKGD
uniref:Uncharacterized protein n=1 Tax=Nelumbo nucifera TaxID=4432 RepID=A0A822XPW3_NELNU|nr:TPA_asm: hypothetical protein HUJ06_023943 [Nelumbo nucifera]